MNKWVLPLLQTNWGQGGDYAQMVTDLGSGTGNNWTNNNIGCQCLALAQILFYHRMQPHHSKVGFYTCPSPSKGLRARIVNLTFGKNYFFTSFPLKIDPATPVAQRTLVQSYLFDVAKAFRKNFYVGYVGARRERVEMLMTHFDVEAKLYEYEIGSSTSSEDASYSSYEDLNGDKLLNLSDAIILIKRELSNNRPLWMFANRLSGGAHAVVVDGYWEDNDGHFWICVKWGDDPTSPDIGINNSDPTNPGYPPNAPWFRLDGIIGDPSTNELDGNVRRFITIRPKRQLPSNLEVYNILSSGELGIRTDDQEFSSGWTVARTYEVANSPFLLLLKYNGIVNFYSLSIDGAVGPELERRDTVVWSTGWNVVNIYAIGLNTYLFILKKKGFARNGRDNVIVHKMNANGTAGEKIEGYQWSEGWTTAEFFKIGSIPYLFILKENGFARNGKDNVIIHKMNADGTVGKKVEGYQWSEGWTTAKLFRIQTTTYLFLLKEQGFARNGRDNVIIHKMNADGTVGKKVEGYQWSEGWTTAELFIIGSSTYLFILKKQGFARNGRDNVIIHEMNADGTVGQKVEGYRWSEGWTSAITYKGGIRNYLLVLKEN